MARILIANTPFIGHISPVLPIARALVGRGHDVRWYTGALFRERVEATGARFVPMVHAPPIGEAADEQQAAEDARRGPVERLKHDLKHAFGDSMPGQMQDLEALHQTWQPDVVLADSTFFGISLYHERYGVPYATIGIVPLPISSRDTAPFGLGILPIGSPLGRLRNGILNWAVEKLIFADVQRHLQEVRARAGFGPMRDFFLNGLSPYLYLQATVPSFEYPRSDLSPTVHFIGPVIGAPPRDYPRPAWWGELESGRPVVHVTQGTVATEAAQLIVPTIQALAEEDLLLVVTTGGQPVESIPLARLPENVRVESFIPHPLLLPHVDAMITNGGYGGVQTALAHGVPLVVAGASEDKPEVANRVQWAGVGLNLRTATPRPEQIRRAVKSILSNRRFAEQAGVLQREYARYSAPQMAAALLEKLAATGQPVQREAAAPASALHLAPEQLGS